MEVPKISSPPNPNVHTSLCHTVYIKLATLYNGQSPGGLTGSVCELCVFSAAKPLLFKTLPSLAVTETEQECGRHKGGHEMVK